MSKQVPWTNKLTELFIETAALSTEEAYIMRSRVKGATITEQALYLNCSESSVHRMISRLKVKYDFVQRESPDIFPERRFSAKETYMDTH